MDPRLLRYAAATRPFFVATVGLGVLTAVLIVAQASLLATAITSTFLHGADLHRLAPTLAGLAAVVVARAVVTGVQEAVARTTSTAVQAQLRNRLVAKVFELGPAWLSGRSSAEISLLSVRGITALDGYFAQYLPQVALGGLVPVVVLGWLLPADLTAFVIVLVTLPLIPVFMALVGLTTQERTRRQWRTLEVLGHHFLDVLSGLTTLKVYGRAKGQAQVVARVSDDYRRATMATLRLAFLSSLVLELLATLSVALVAVAVGLRLVAGDLDLRTALLVLILAPEAYLPLRRLGASYHASAEGLAAASEVFDILEAPVPQGLPTGVTQTAPGQPVTLRVERLVVRRPQRPEAVLDRLDLEVGPGELVALTGPSGCGKSTLLDVLLGFVPAESGSVLVGGVPLTDLDRRAWRDRVGWVPQQPHVVTGTVAANVRLGHPAADDQAVRGALRAAGDLLAELPDGPDTVVGEDGLGLSIGQLRRLALARALVQDRPLLLLDEPTAGLDPQAEAAVVQTLRARAERASILVVSHRPAVLAAADRIITLAPAVLVPASPR